MRTDSLRGARTLRLLSLFVAGALAWPTGVRAHVDDPMLLQECGSCHVGHGVSGQPMLGEVEEEVCFRCHGADEARTREIAAGNLAAGAELQDLEREFRKPYRHPVVEGSGHSPTERLDGGALTLVNHAECVDCHNPHQRRAPGQRTVFDVSGRSVTGQYLETSLYEYEVCLKCHGERPVDGQFAHSLREEFDANVRSQHPVTRDPSGRHVPSLRPELANRRMMCSDCHGNDDRRGPRGPHGSRHRFLLAGNYDTEVYTDESPYAFELCYMCHDRESILSDESFPQHRLHVVGDPLSNRSGTSCYTCHASHGAIGAPGLVRFNPQAVDPEPTARRLEYRPATDRAGECFLSCHGYDHSPDGAR